MSICSQIGWRAALCVLATPMAFAQVDQVLATTDGPAPMLSVPILEYTSSFANYHAFTDQAVLPWRETNEAVRQIGGWRAYAKEVLQPEEPAATAAPSPAVTGAKP